MKGNQTFFTNDRAFENAYLVYIQGIEVPATSVSIRYEIGSLPVATVQLAPDPELARLGMEDRVEVQVFYKDNFFTTVKGVPSEFCLLFDGTIEGWSYSHNAFGRNMSFQVSHCSKILQDTTMFFLSGIESAVKAVIQPSVSVGSVTATLPDLLSPWSILFCGLFAKENKFMKRPYDLINNFFQASLNPKTLGENQSIINAAFLIRLLERRRFLYQFIPSPILEFSKTKEYNVFPLLASAQGENIVHALGARIQQLGGNVSIWDIFSYVYSQMYYEVGTILAPPIAQVDFKSDSTNYGGVIGTPKWYGGYKFDATTPPNPLITPWVDDTKPNFLVSHISKPQWMFGIAPACNVVFPSMVEEINFSESYSAQPTRCYVDNREVFTMLDTSTRQPINSIVRTRGAYPPQVDSMLQKNTSDSITSAKNLLVWPAEFFRGPQSIEITTPPIIQTLKNETINSCTDKELKAQVALDFINMRVKSISETALAQAQVSVDAEIAAKQMFPATSDLLGTSEDRAAKIFEQLSAELLNQSQVLINELKTQGILTEDVISVSQLQAQLSKKVNAQLTTLAQIVRRYAQYEYYRQGSGARSGTVNMAFNPYIVVGFPIILFNSLEDGNHFVGYVAGIEHQLSPRGMRTSVSFIMGQTMDEYLNNIVDARIGNNIDHFVDDVSAAPAHPVGVLRQVTQYQDQAEDYFSKVFHQNQRYRRQNTTPTTENPKLMISTRQVKEAAFDIFKAVRFKIAGNEYLYSLWDVLEDTSATVFKQRMKSIQDELERNFESDYKKAVDSIKTMLSVAGLEGSMLDAALEAEVAPTKTMLKEYYYQMGLIRFMKAQRTNPENKILDSYTELRPASEFAPMFEGYESAMRYVSRPVCTLEEYVKFRGAWGWARGTIPADDPMQGKGAVFYEKILNFKEGPGDPPTLDPKTGVPIKPAPKDLPETRLPWSARLVNYRNLFLYGKVPTNT